jgi:hypothetical protein
VVSSFIGILNDVSNVIYCRLYYKFNPTRLPMCPLTIHALLHIGPTIRALGPVWAYWAFPMEHYCGTLSRNIKNRRYPFISLNNYVSASVHLTQVQSIYNLFEELSFDHKPSKDGQLKLKECKCFKIESFSDVHI